MSLLEIILIMVVVASFAAHFWSTMKHLEKNRELVRLNNNVAILDHGRRQSEEVVYNLRGDIADLNDTIKVRDQDILDLVALVEKKNKVITEMAHEVNKPTVPKAQKVQVTDSGARTMKKAKAKSKSKK